VGPRCPGWPKSKKSGESVRDSELCGLGFGAKKSRIQGISSGAAGIR